MYFHVWFVTKYRKSVLEGGTDREVKSIFEECIKRHGYRVMEFETNRDHVHMLIEVNNRQELSEIMRTLKAVSAREILRTPRFRVGNGTGYRRRAPVAAVKSFWARRYGSRQIREHEIDYIRTYVRDQRKISAKISLAFALAVLMGTTAWGNVPSPTATWQKISNGIFEPAVVKMAVHPSDPSTIFAATNKALYRSSDGGKHYRAVFQASGEFQGINDIYIDPHQPQNIYAATDAGLYESRDAGHHWERSYYSSDEQSRKCLTLLRAGETLYLGTGRGLFYKPAEGKNWVSVGNELSRKPVNHIASGERFIYFATDDAVYDLDRKMSGYSRIFTAGSAQTIAADESESASGSEEEAAQPLVRFVRVAKDDDTTLYVATARGIYLSGDQGQHWRLLANPPVDLQTLNAFVVLGEEEDRRLLVGTKRGAFLFDDGRWTPMYQGMETNAMNDLATDTRGRVYAATDRGVFYLSDGQALFPFPSEGHGGADEPTIQQVHRWAIDYAEVSPDKIKNWRALAGKRALLPDFSVGLDRAESEFYHWDTGTNPDTLIKGKDLLNWDVSLSWDLGDLIWSTDQTTIDSRSKMMVELREDVLDQVTRLYFERRRLQAELAVAGALEPAVKFDKQLRVEELTALLDAFTGGKFSNAIAGGHNVIMSQSHQSSDVSRQSSDISRRLTAGEK